MRRLSLIVFFGWGELGEKQLINCPGILNPFTAPAGKISGLKHSHTGLQTGYCFGSATNLLSILCILIEIPSHTNAKKEKGRSIENFALLLVVFKRHLGSERVNPDKNLKKLCG